MKTSNRNNNRTSSANVRNFKPSVENEINLIFRHLTNTADDNMVVRKERTEKGASCKGFICLYDKEEIKEEKPIPTMKYAFYESTYCPTKIGSVAVYGSDLQALYLFLKKNRRLFGRDVVNVMMEVGRRPYLDITFAA